MHGSVNIPQTIQQTLTEIDMFVKYQFVADTGLKRIRSNLIMMHRMASSKCNSIFQGMISEIIVMTSLMRNRSCPVKIRWRLANSGASTCTLMRAASSTWIYSRIASPLPW